MKSFKLIILSVLTLASIYSCRSEGSDEKYYDGELGLHFNITDKSSVLVNSGESKVVQVEYGTLANVKEDSNVKLVIDNEASDVFQAGAIDILNNGQSVIAKGTSKSYFEVKLSGDYLTSDAKKVVFNLESATIQNASFNQQYTLEASQVCSISSFVGTFSNDIKWWVETDNPVFQIVEGEEPNTLVIKDFFEQGRDFNLKYDPNTYVVTWDPQYTGWYYNNNGVEGEVNAEVKSSGATTSTFNPCTRELDLYVYYVIPTANAAFGEKNEHFIGQ